MHKLGRSVRFSINPFLTQDGVGANSYASKPAGEGLALFFELWTELTGPIDPDTGFIVNVTEIDDIIRHCVVPFFSERIRIEFRAGRHVSTKDLTELLRLSWGLLKSEFVPAKLSRLGLKISPFKELAMNSIDSNKVVFSERFEFAATHKLWNDKFSERENFEVFGKCANPAGHGHNYIVEVTIEIEAGGDFNTADFERVVNDDLIEVVDHRNLNTEVEDFGQVIPTVENIAKFAWDRLVGKFPVGNLHKVTVWETDKTYCSYCR